MAKLVIVALQDVQAQAFNRPFFVPTVGMATRQIADEVNRPANDNILYQHPEDFRVFELGTFDESSGKFETHIPELVVDCSALRADKV